MRKVPGRPLQDLLLEGALIDHSIDAIARVLATAMRRYWSAGGNVYGDFNIDNILCDPEKRILALVDPGMPERAFHCPAATRRWYPASRDLAYVLFDTATSIRSSIFRPALRRRQWRLVSGLISAAVYDVVSTPSGRESLIQEISDCCQAHLRRINTPWSPRGLVRHVVRFLAAARMNHLLAQLSDEMSPAIIVRSLASEDALCASRVGTS
jgi:hypothetical protein